MKKTLIVLALGSLALTACSGSSDSKPATRFDIENFKLAELQSETRFADAAEYGKESSKAGAGAANCDEKSFDSALRSANFKVEENSISLESGSFSSRKNVFVKSVTAEELHADVRFDLFQVSVLPGQIFENNQAQMVCKIDSSKSSYPSCDLSGEYTQAAKDYMASHSTSDRTRSHCHSESAGETKSIYSKGVFVLEDGTKVPALVSKYQMVSTETCDGQAPRKTVSTYIGIVSLGVVAYPDGSSRCQGGKLFSRYVSQTESNVTTNDYTFKMLRAPRK